MTNPIAAELDKMRECYTFNSSGWHTLSRAIAEILRLEKELTELLEDYLKLDRELESIV
jgi:hypothetical protein